MILQGNDNARVPPFGMFALVLLTVLTMPTWTLGEVAAQGVEETNMEALITVWPYDLSTSGLVVLPEETHWAVHPNYNGGSAQGGDDRLIVVLQDPTTRDGFWPVIVKMPLSDARTLQADLARVISAKPPANETDGMDSLIGTAAYSLDQNGQKALYGEAVWRVMSRFMSLDQQGEIAEVDNRLTVVLEDSTRKFWPVIVRMDSGVAQTFMADLAQVIARKTLTLAAAPAASQTGMTAHRDIDYLGGLDYPHDKDKLDVLMPVGATNAPVIVFFHGGALQSGNKRTGALLASTLVAQGIGVVTANYRLSPGVMHPAHMEDATAAFVWTKRHISEYGGDPERVFVGGHSAGAYLAALMSLDPSYLKAQGMALSAIRGAVPVSPFLYVEETARDRPKTVWGTDETAWLKASVTPYIGAGKPPMRLIYADGDEDWRRAQNERLKTELSNAGSQVDTVEIADRTHGSIMSKMGDKGDAAMKQIAAFIEAH